MNTNKKCVLLLSTTMMLSTLFMTGVAFQGEALSQSNETNQTAPLNGPSPPTTTIPPPNDNVTQNYEPPITGVAEGEDVNCGDPRVPDNVKVIGEDVYGLDGNNDGTGCQK